MKTVEAAGYSRCEIFTARGLRGARYSCREAFEARGVRWAARRSRTGGALRGCWASPPRSDCSCQHEGTLGVYAAPLLILYIPDSTQPVLPPVRPLPWDVGWSSFGGRVTAPFVGLAPMMSSRGAVGGAACPATDQLCPHAPLWSPAFLGHCLAARVEMLAHVLSKGARCAWRRLAAAGDCHVNEDALLLVRQELQGSAALRREPRP
eukprot:NODE_2763_length_879_cov_256.547330.p1 GENE.NODE_2763_length_879_cov_256.547330~~NODE_2763_length_879_cov_256.547330.p1  ORF type:complete len:207 (-),score=0.64 NODE_2763_length_879_cov_256.547330:91-711(-)